MRACQEISAQPLHCRLVKLAFGRNVMKGKVKNVKEGVVNTEVVIELPGGLEIVSVITKESAQNLGLSNGKDVHAIIKASNVMVAVE